MPGIATSPGFNILKEDQSGPIAVPVTAATEGLMVVVRYTAWTPNRKIIWVYTNGAWNGMEVL